MLPALERRVVPALRAFGEAPVLLAIREALPWSFIGLVVGLAYYMAFVASGSLFARLNASLLPALAVMGVCLTVILAFFLARRLGLNPYVFVPACIVAFALGMPRPFAPADPVYARELGSSALFLALVVDLVAAGIVVLAERFVPKAFATLAGAAVVVAISVGLYGAGISLGAELLGAIRPLGTLGDTYLALVTITFIEAALWMLGIHGPALLAAVVTPVYLTLQFANTDAFAHHRPLPHIVTVSTFLFVFPGGAGATLPLVLHLLRSRVSRIRKVALAALVPGIFNTNEPLMFGLPVVLEPILAIPYIGVPCVLATTTYFAMAYGWVGRPVLYIPSTVPTLVSVFLATYDWRAIVLAGLNIALGYLLYWPFVRVYERHAQSVAAERAARAS